MSRQVLGSLAGRAGALLLLGAVVGGLIGWRTAEPTYRAEGLLAALPATPPWAPAWGALLGPLLALLIGRQRETARLA